MKIELSAKQVDVLVKAAQADAAGWEYAARCCEREGLQDLANDRWKRASAIRAVIEAIRKQRTRRAKAK